MFISEGPVGFWKSLSHHMALARWFRSLLGSSDVGCSLQGQVSTGSFWPPASHGSRGFQMRNLAGYNVPCSTQTSKLSLCTLELGTLTPIVHLGNVQLLKLYSGPSESLKFPMPISQNACGRICNKELLYTNSPYNHYM